ncbi:MAG: TM1266 family iron-only hydrogenase system putative regulator [Bacteroidota bacterium]
MDDRRLGVIGVVLENPAGVQAALNLYISEASEIIVGRMGIPYRERNVALLALIVDGTLDQINTLTGRLGSLPGISVRAAVTKK